MTGYHIFAHSLRLVLRNLGDAFRVSAVLYAVQLAYKLLYFVKPPQMQDMGDGVMVPVLSVGQGTVFILLGIAATVASLWIAVAWHRYVLASEYPTSWVPPWHGPYLLGYLGRSILIGLVVVAALVVASLPLGLFATMFPGLWALFGAAMLALGAFVFFRLSPILPAAALGRPITLPEAWRATKDETGTFLTLAAVVVAAALVIRLPSLLNNDPASLINLIYGVVTNWFATIIGISVLTTIYGVFIEKRPLS